jgi:hypothetical protein
MALFEVLTAFSASAAIAIPTFMDKVMRPKYEERFSEFRKARRDTFLDEFEDAFNKLKKTKEEMTPETIEAMEKLFGEWGQVKTDENKLTTLLRMRKFFYIGWFVVSGLCLFSIQYSESVIGQTNLTLGQVTIYTFAIMFLASLWYGYKLFDLDEELSKFKSETTGAAFGKTESVRISVASYLLLEQKVETTLKKFKIPFEKNALLKVDGVLTEVDFVVPSSHNPKYVIEVKSILRHPSIYDLSLRFKEIKNVIPLKTILISNFRAATLSITQVARTYWDFTVDFQDLEKLKEIIQLESKP